MIVQQQIGLGIRRMSAPSSHPNNNLTHLAHIIQHRPSSQQAFNALLATNNPTHPPHNVNTGVVGPPLQSRGDMIIEKRQRLQFQPSQPDFGYIDSFKIVTDNIDKPPGARFASMFGHLF